MIIYTLDDGAKPSYTRHWSKRLKADVTCPSVPTEEIPVDCSIDKLVVLPASNSSREKFPDITEVIE